MTAALLARMVIALAKPEVAASMPVLRASKPE